MKSAMTAMGAVAIIALGILAFYMIDIDQTRETRLPDVNVDVEPGQMPAYDAEVGSIEVTEEEVTVPDVDVDVTMDEETVTVPGLELNSPNNDG